MNSPWKLILLLTGIFLAGAVTGGFVAQRHIRKEFSKRFAPEQWCPTRLEMLTKRLDLTSEQQAKLKPIMQRDMDDLVRTRNNTVAEARRIIDRMERDIAAELTPEQRVKFEQISREKRERTKRFLRDKVPGFREERKRLEEDRPAGAPEATPKPEKPGSTI